MRFSRLLLFFSLLVGWTVSGVAQVRVSLLSSVESVRPGQAFEAALRIEHEAGWHTYWVYGGLGYPTTLAWTLPEGWSAGPIEWPVPSLIHDYRGEVSGQGYEGTVLLPFKITPPANAALGAVTLKAKADWLMCDPRQCMPGDAEVSLTIEIAPDAPAPSSSLAEFSKIKRPQAPPARVNVRAETTGGTIRIIVENPPDALLAAKPAPHFFTENDAVVYDAPQTIRRSANEWELSLQSGPGFPESDARVRGVLAFESAGRYQGWSLDLVARKGPGTSAPLAGTQNGGGSAGSGAVGGGLWGTLALAVLGGLILNLMPCVFPVLGIKIMGFVRQAGNDRRRVTLHGIAFTFGVLVSFWVLAGLLAILRRGGAELGWGFQLQSPVFVFVLAAMLLVFALSMSGVFEFGLRATGVGAGLQHRDGLGGSFFTGVLATVVATPCSAPFLAPALGAALTLPTGQGFAVFTAIAIGLSLPYLLLSVFPALVERLPRPGAWMETFRRLMAFPLYATVGYLLWVLAGQVAEEALLKMFIGLTVLALGVWLYGHYTNPLSGMKRARRRTGMALGLLVLLLGAGLGWPRAPKPDAIVWETWKPGLAERLQAEGKTVYVDFTARWCATCQTNKQVVFGSKDVRRQFRERGIVALKADWTSMDPAITEALGQWGRKAVPFNLVYRPNEAPEPLPELLTPSVVLGALEPRS